MWKYFANSQELYKCKQCICTLRIRTLNERNLLINLNHNNVFASSPSKYIVMSCFAEKHNHMETVLFIWKKIYDSWKADIIQVPNISTLWFHEAETLGNSLSNPQYFCGNIKWSGIATKDSKERKVIHALEWGC